jgi:hypothetical protein
VLDRLERDPDPVQLTASRSLAEIEELIEPRLALLFERQNVIVRPEQPLYPFSHAELETLVNQRTRDVLDWCRAHHEASIHAGRISTPPTGPGQHPASADQEVLQLEQAWNDHLAGGHAPPDDEAERVALITWALDALSRELPGCTPLQPSASGVYQRARKAALRDLLKRGRSAGLGVFLATQSPGDFDYKCRDNIRTWFVGRVAEKTAVDKMKPLLTECRINVGAKLAQAKTGEFFKLEEGEVIELRADQSLMRTTQMTEDSILQAAQRKP